MPEVLPKEKSKQRSALRTALRKNTVFLFIVKKNQPNKFSINMFLMLGIIYFIFNLANSLAMIGAMVL